MLSDVAGALGTITPLIIAIGTGFWVVYRHVEERRKKKGVEGEAESATVLQGKPVVRPEWTLQDAYLEIKDELSDSRKALERSGHREDAYREALIRLQQDPRVVLQAAGLSEEKDQA